MANIVYRIIDENGVWDEVDYTNFYDAHMAMTSNPLWICGWSIVSVRLG